MVNGVVQKRHKNASEPRDCGITAKGGAACIVLGSRELVSGTTLRHFKDAFLIWLHWPCL